MPSKKRKQRQQRKSDKYMVQNIRNPHPSLVTNENFNSNSEEINRIFEFSTISLKKAKALSTVNQDRFSSASVNNNLCSSSISIIPNQNSTSSSTTSNRSIQDAEE